MYESTVGRLLETDTLRLPAVSEIQRVRLVWGYCVRLNVVLCGSWLALPEKDRETEKDHRARNEGRKACSALFATAKDARVGAKQRASVQRPKCPAHPSRASRREERHKNQSRGAQRQPWAERVVEVNV